MVVCIEIKFSVKPHTFKNIKTDPIKHIEIAAIKLHFRIFIEIIEIIPTWLYFFYQFKSGLERDKDSNDLLIK